MLRIVKKIIGYFVLFVLASFLIFLGYLVSKGNDAAILMYHSIGERMEKDSTLNVSLEAFEKQMAFLKQYHYKVISLSDLVELMRARKKISAKTVVITFDDGYENFYTNALPVLKKYSFPATVFVITNFIGKKEQMYGHFFSLMNVDMLKDLLQPGLISIGAHTKNHIYLPKEKNDIAVYDEILGSKEVLERILSEPVDLFCYPNGGYNEKIKNYVKMAGYKTAVTTFPRKSFGEDDIYALKRVKVTESAKNPFIFFIEASGYYLKMKEMSSGKK